MAEAVAAPRGDARPGLQRVAPFAAMAVLGLGALVIPDPQRPPRESTAAPVAVAGQVEQLAPEDEIALHAPTTEIVMWAFPPPPVSVVPSRSRPSEVRTASAPLAPPTTPIRPLQVTDLGWSSAITAGTPAGSAGIPERALPVGATATGPDKVSWFRLAGGGPGPLVLHPVDDPGANRAEGTATVELCRSTTADWTAGPNQDASAQPPVDASACVDGARDADGSWSFDIAPLGPIEDPRGFVLVPGAGVFQVVYAAPA